MCAYTTGWNHRVCGLNADTEAWNTDFSNNTNRASEVYKLPPSFRFPLLREGNQVARGLGSPCGQGEPLGGGLQSRLCS
jgi:hypothetical protein